MPHGLGDWNRFFKFEFCFHFGSTKERQQFQLIEASFEEEEMYYKGKYMILLSMIPLFASLLRGKIDMFIP